MGIRIKNWSKHQHFKDRTPPWIKLYRELLDDPDWHELDGESAKTLMGLWLIASEDETHTGTLPDTRKLAFRLRIKESQLNQALTKLSDWLIRDDIKPISSRYQGDAPETETETETEVRASRSDDGEFTDFWTAYPRKVGKPAALKAFRSAKINGNLSTVLEDIEARKVSEAWLKGGGQYIPHPSTYLNQRRWEDEEPAEQTSMGGFL